MKRTILIALVFACAIMGLNAQSNREIWQNGAVVEMSGNFYVNITDDYHSFTQRPHEFSAGGGYQWYLTQGLFVQPTIDIFFGRVKHHGSPIDAGSYPLAKPNFLYKEWGFRINGLVGYSIPIMKLNSLSFLTGVRASQTLHISEKGNGIQFPGATYYSHKRLIWYWTTGAQFNLQKHYYVKTSFNFAIKRHSYGLINCGNGTRLNNFEFGLGYKF